MTIAERASVTLRPFDEADYPAYVAIANECYPDYAWTVEEVRHMDADWTPDGYFRRRRIAEAGGVAVGYSDAANARGQLVPENYRLEVLVRPAARRRGKVDPDAVRKAYRLHQEARLDVPSLDPPAPSPYERFEEEVLRSPFALPEAFFIAIRDGGYVGESAMGKEGTDPGVIYQRLTGVLRDERGKGIAMALKLRTIDYAKAVGFREIRTWNASLNRPMLSINEALRFVKQPAWITFGKDLSTS